MGPLNRKVEYDATLARRAFHFLAVSTVLCCLSVPFATAQVITDGTLGARSVLLGPNYIVTASLGRVAGANLFHSFSSLTIRQGQSVNFLADGTIQSVIARVTSGQPNTIDGQIRSTGGAANVFILNPAGIFFGPNASLNVPASFYASTADYLRFSDGSRFNTLIFGGPNDQFPTTSPQAFGFLERATNIQLTGSQLRVGDGRTIGLIGGNLSMTNQGTRVSVVSAPGGAIAAVASGGASEVLLNGRFDVGAPSGRLDILGGTLVAVNEGVQNRGSGRVVIRGGEVYVERSSVTARTRNGNGGDIDVEATNLLSMKTGEINGVTTGAGNAAHISLKAADILMQDASFVDTSCDPGCTTGKGGGIDISASRSLVMRSDIAGNPQFIASNSFGNGATGLVSINTPLLSMTGRSSIQSVTQGTENSSGITINVGTLQMMAGAQIDTSSRGAGKGGVLTVNASDLVELVGDRLDASNQSIPSGLFTNAYSSGDAGSIQVKTARLNILAGGEISSSTFRNSTGRGGAVGIAATRDVTIAGQSKEGKRSSIVTNTFSMGAAGTVTIAADRLIVEDMGLIQAQSENDGDAGGIVFRGGDLIVRTQGQISSDTRGLGLGGTVEIFASRSVDISGLNGGLFAKTYGPATGGAIVVRAPEVRLSNGGGIYATTDASGRANSIDIFTDRLSMTTGSAIAAETSLTGNAGRILVQAEKIEIDQSKISTFSGGAGAAGSINLRGGELLIKNSGSVISNAFSFGAGGSIDISMARGVTISGRGAGLFAKTTGPAVGGSIMINSSDMRMADAAAISVTASGSGRSGSIDISTARVISMIGGSSIEAASGGTGNAGNIAIHTGEGIDISQSRVTTSARSADGGNISVTTDGKLVMFEGRIETEVGTGLGDGGNVNVNGSMMVLRNSAISANAFGGDGGNIRIASANVLANTISKVTASSQLGIDGTVQFESPAADLSGALFSVTSSFLDATAVLASSCVSPQIRARSSLAMRILDPDHQRELGYLFPIEIAQGVRGNARFDRNVVDGHGIEKVGLSSSSSLLASLAK